MTEEEREGLVNALHDLAKSIEQSGDERDVATAGCLYGLCLAIREGAEVDLFRRMFNLDAGEDIDLASLVGPQRSH